MPAPDSVKQLIDTFDNNLDFYKSEQYNEYQLRREFIDPFFKSLGWDMDNEAGVAPQYRDVIHEASIKIGGSTKAPDYAFSIHGQYKFFLEAKKPAVNVQDEIDPAYQLRRYGWSAKLPVSILTDFEEFSIYDCRTRPKRGEKAATSRIGYFKYTHYIDKWDELRDTFSKDAILKGSFDKYTVDARRHRGTETVDDAFLAEIEHWRNLLARNFALRNPALSVRDLNFAVQKTIDRIIFLRICEDRGTEDYKRLAALLNGARTYERLLEQFMQADDRYNSGLFHFSAERGRGAPDTVTPNLRLDDRVLKEIISKLYYPESPYEFSVLPADILGQVYEQFLGKTIHLTHGHQARIEEKPEVRKAGGVYYTPGYIVDYIVRNTLGRLLDGDDPANPRPIALSRAADIKVLDPACGSGSFLIVAYQYLLDWHLRQYTADPETSEPDEGKIKRHSGGKNPKIYQSPGGAWKLTTDERKRILLNNIFGVDIDAQAVEVTKLSLLLKVIEGETDQITQYDWIRKRQRILPDLGNNIRCGNSLIGPDFYDNAQMLLLDEEAQYRINVFDWNQAFPAIMRRGGFDCVIGNPPYIRIQAMKEWAPQEIEFYKQNLDSAFKGNFDIYVCFIEKGLQLLSSRGKLGYIVPHKFFNAQYGEQIRRIISDGKHLEQFVHFGHQQVFTEATTYTCLLFLSKAPTNVVTTYSVNDINAWQNGLIPTCSEIEANIVSSEPWIFGGSSLANHLAKKEMLIPLGELTRLFVGVQTDGDAVFILQEAVDNDGVIEAYSKALDKRIFLEVDLLRPLLKGSVNLSRYEIKDDGKRLLFPYNPKSPTELLALNKIEMSCPLTRSYISSVESILRKRGKGKLGELYYGYVYKKNHARMSGTKILCPSIARGAAFSYDHDGHFFFTGSGSGGGGAYGIRLKEDSKLELRYLLGVLNSKISDKYFKDTSTPFRGGWIALTKQHIEHLPIRTIDFDNPGDVEKHNRMVALVERMLELHQKKSDEKNPETLRLLETQIAATDRQIDRLVYDLYDLTSEEIALVERGTAPNGNSVELHSC